MIGKPETFFEICDEIDRLYDWAIATHPHLGDTVRTELTRQKIHEVASYWLSKLDAITEEENKPLSAMFLRVK